jgi:hypothetical protein
MPRGALKSETAATQEGPGDDTSAEQAATAPPTGGHEIAWTEVIPSDQWDIYKRALVAVRRAGIKFLVGGGFGLAGYTGRWRNTKDMDLYVVPDDREKIVEVLTSAGFEDYFSVREYDRGWIYRSHRDGIIVDVIWSMANRRAQVASDWFERAPQLQVRDEVLNVVAAEELLWCKIYVFQRDHCDWTDVINLIYAVGPQLNWDVVLKRLGPDFPLLRSVLTQFSWLTPSRAAELPDSLFTKLHLEREPFVPPRVEMERIRLLDTRAWFAASQPKDKVLEV